MILPDYVIQPAENTCTHASHQYSISLGWGQEINAGHQSPVEPLKFRESAMAMGTTTSKQSLEQWQLEGSSAAAYERYLVPALFAEWADRLIDTARPKRGDRVLDAACGTGIVARSVSRRVGPDGEVVGVDLNEGMLEVAGEAARFTEPPVTWRQGSVEDLPFDDESFDIVFCQQALQFLSNPVNGLREIRRVLVPGGRAALNVCRSVDVNPAYRILAECLGRHAGEVGRTMMESPFSRWSPETLRGHLTDAGFENPHISIDHIAGRFASPAEFLMQEAASSPLANEIAGLSDDARVALVTDVEKSLADFVDDDGIACSIAFYVVSAVK